VVAQSTRQRRLHGNPELSLDAIASLVEFGLSTRYEDLPPSVIERSRSAIADTFAAMVGGYRARPVPELVALAAEWGGKPEATILAGGYKGPMPLAALVNGATARVLDLDDVHEQNTCHVSATIVPAALAVSEACGPIDGRRFMSSVAVGAELICRLSAAPKLGFSETGHSLTYQCGIFGSALVAARLMSLPLALARHSMGIAYARLAGNQQGLLSAALTVPWMQGVAAEGGVLAAILAQRGITGSHDVLEGRFGYYPVYQRGEYEPRALTEGLGTRWYMEEISVKPVYPCCKFIHGPIDALMAAMRQDDIAPEGIRSMRFKVTNREAYELVCAPPERKRNPASVPEAQFSLPFMAAWAAVHGCVDFRSMSEAALQDRRVRALMRAIDTDPVFEVNDGRGDFPVPGIVEITQHGGRVTRGYVKFVRGHPRNPMPYDELAGKLVACGAYGYPAWRNAGRVADRLRNLEDCRDVSELAALLQAAH
jgi:2-methylcitrate dehydratase PrpD